MTYLILAQLIFFVLFVWWFYSDSGFFVFMTHLFDLLVNLSASAEHPVTLSWYCFTKCYYFYNYSLFDLSYSELQARKCFFFYHCSKLEIKWTVNAFLSASFWSTLRFNLKKSLSMRFFKLGVFHYIGSKFAHHSWCSHVVQADKTAVTVSFSSLSPCLLRSLSVCLPVPRLPPSNSISDTVFLLPACSRSQSLGDGPVSPRFWAQRWCPQPQKPLCPRVQWNSKRRPVLLLLLLFLLFLWLHHRASITCLNPPANSPERTKFTQFKVIHLPHQDEDLWVDVLGAMRQTAC